MSKILTPFERELKDKMAGYEMPYEQRSWFMLQRSMSASKMRNSPWLVALLAATLVTGGSAIAIYQNKNATSVAKMASGDDRFSNYIVLQSPAGNNDNGLVINDPSALNTTSAQTGAYQVDGSQISEGAFNATQNLTQNNNNLNLSNSTTSGSTTDNNTGIAENSAVSKTKDGKEIKTNSNVLGFNSSVRTACEGVEVLFAVTNGPQSGSYLWNFGDGRFSDEVNPKHKFGKAGNYDVSLSVTSDNGQIETTVMNDMITIQESPNADFVWEFVNTDPASPAVRIIDHSENGNKYEWTFSGGIISDIKEPVITLRPDGKQTIAVNVINEYGCSDGAVKHISINSDFKLDAPSTLKVGKDLFMPYGLKQNKVNFNMVIQDNQGNKVFETSNRLKGWDGKLPGGQYAMPGEDYSWKIIITNDLSREQKYFNGKLTISP